MEDLKRIVLTLFIFSLSIFIIVQGVSAQETWKERRQVRREKFREKIREKAIEKKREELTKPGTEAGLGGIDARIPLKWITGIEQEVVGFVYGVGDYGRKLRFGGIERFYEIHVPPGYGITQPAPVVLNFHGGGGYPAGARYQSGMDLVSDKNGFIVVYPAGTGKLFNDRLLTWNDGRPDKDGKPYTADDVGFVAALLDDLAVFFNVDSMRIYATGISNGAQFSYTLANKLSDRIAAIATIAGHRTVDQYFPPPPRPISVMQFSGLEDKLAPYYGGTPPKKAGPVTIDFEWTMRPVKEAILSWATHNGCSTEFAEATMIGKAVMTRFSSQCKDNTEVILWTLEDGGHTWPGGKMFPSEVKAGLGHLNTDISASELMWGFFKGHTLNNRTASSLEDVDISQTSCENDTCSKDEVKSSYSSSCGNGVCEDSETDATCSKDCCAKIFRISKDYEQECVNRGWNKLTVDAGGRPRKALWKGPDRWEHGAIIALHGGSGSAPVFCFNDIPGAKAAADFGNLAVSQGFAVFSLDSLYNIATDPEGRGIGKRFDLIETTNRKNVDLPYIEKVITETIPQLRPKGSSEAIFITGHSTGAFTTVLAATHFNDKITAFAPVSGGDPYGAYLDMGVQEKLGRSCTPGGIFDSETHKGINGPNSSKADAYPNEKKWPKTIKNIPFRQFHHQLDYIADISNMYKVREQLIKHGYQEDPAGPFVLTLDADPDYVSSLCLYNDPRRKGRRGVRGEKLVCIEEHYFQEQYSQPLLDFFKKHSMKSDRGLGEVKPQN